MNTTLRHLVILSIVALAIALVFSFISGCTTEQAADLDAVINQAIASIPTSTGDPQVAPVSNTPPAQTNDSESSPASPVSTGDPQVAPPVAPSDLSGYIFHTTTANVAASPVVSELKITRLTGSVFRYELVGGTWPVKDGTVGNLMCALYRDGAWHAGPSDAMKPAPNSKGYKSICVPQGKQRLYEPIKGERVRVWVQGICRNSSKVDPDQRSSIVELIWGE